MTRENIYFIIFLLCRLMICIVLFFFPNSDEEPSYSDFYPIIPADLMSVKEILNMDDLPRHRTW